MERWQQYYQRLAATLIPRRYLPRAPDRSLGLAISGVRRCGKTTLAIQLSQAFDSDRILYYNFEDPLFLDATNPSGIEQLFTTFEQQHGAPPELTILDEVQNVEGWERWVRSSIDQQRTRIIVTGSNAKLLSAELSTSLTGRSLEHTAWPLSISEVQDFFKSKFSSPHSAPPNLEYCLQQLITWGGLPAIVLMQDSTAREQLLRQYLSDMIHRDIINRRQIRNKRALDQILSYYQTNISSLHSYSAIKNAFQIPIDTVAEYTAALNEAFLIFEVARYHPNLKTQTRDPRKVYAIDMGLRQVSARSAEIDIGKRLENIIYLELRRQSREIFYYQDMGEVDFILTEEYQPIAAIQVCAYGMDIQKTREREINALVACMKELELNEGTIITMDRDEIIELDGMRITSVSASKWLSYSGLQKSRAIK